MSYMDWKDKAEDFKKMDVRGIQGNFFPGLKKQASGMNVGDGFEVIQSFGINAAPLPDGFDGSVFPDGLETVPKRVAILRANQYMIRHCNNMIVYDAGHIGNTRTFVSQAHMIKGLQIDNVAKNL